MADIPTLYVLCCLTVELAEYPCPVCSRIPNLFGLVCAFHASVTFVQSAWPQTRTSSLLCLYIFSAEPRTALESWDPVFYLHIAVRWRSLSFFYIADLRPWFMIGRGKKGKINRMGKAKQKECVLLLPETRIFFFLWKHHWCESNRLTMIQQSVRGKLRNIPSSWKSPLLQGCEWVCEFLCGENWW